MKKAVLIFALLGLGLICLQQKSYAEKKTSHVEYRDMAMKECASCHANEGIANSHDADVVRSHRLTAGTAGNNCSQCHDQKWCLDCHKGGGSGADPAQGSFGRDYKPNSHRSDFISIHPLKAQGNPQQCYRCHDAAAFCNSCHSRFPTGSMRIKSHLPSGSGQSFIWSSEHASEARRNLQSCQSCHQDGDVCLRCHSAKSGGRINPHPGNFKGRNISSRTSKNCRVCH